MKASDEALLRKGRPFKDWMLDETEIGLTEENQRDFCGGKYASFLQAVDQLAPSSAVVVPVEKMREALAATPALFIAAPDDMFISFDDEREQFEKLKSPESRFATIPGGHAALYSKPGVNAIRAFVKSAH
jgi:pimeloyl-ACP methyl ester carboxylesterase